MRALAVETEGASIYHRQRFAFCQICRVLSAVSAYLQLSLGAEARRNRRSMLGSPLTSILSLA